MIGATARQLVALRFIAEHIVRHGYPPTIREIGTAMGIRSTNAVAQHLTYLERKQLLTLAPVSSALSRGRVPTKLGWLMVGMEPPPPPSARRVSNARAVELNLGWRCTVCNAHTFDPSKPCAICALERREKVAV
jgi:SOS-response transcriptional repressor LexA